MDTRDQYKTLTALVGLNFDDLNTKAKTAYDERTEFNRDAKRARSAAEQVVMPDEPPEEVDLEAITAQIESAEQHNTEVLAREHAQQRVADRIATHRSRLEYAEQALARAQEEVAQAKAELDSAEADLAELPEPGQRRDLGEMRERLNAGTRANEAARDYRNARARKDELEQEAENAEAAAARRTETIDECKASAKKQIEEANMPVEGLSLEDGQVVFNGLPLEQASDADKLRVSCAIAMRGDHKLRVIRVRDGSLLDEDSLAVLSEMADAADYQCWIERVESDKSVGFFIEDGRLVDAEG